MTIKEKLQNLSEDEFRKKVVIPLLRVLGFRKVEDWCGPNEKGKDVLYVREDLLGLRILGAVLIKNGGNITKSGKNDIKLIRNQAEEAMGSPIPDSSDPYNQTTIRELYILTSFNIKREARDYVLDTLRNSQLYLRFVDGDLLEDKIKKVIEKSYYVFAPDNFEEFCDKQIATRPREKEVVFEPVSVSEISEGKNIEPKLAKINQIIQSGQYSQNQGIILDFLKDEELKFYFLSKLPDKFEDLREIEFLLGKLVKDDRPFKLINILRESANKRNNNFIINFIDKYYEERGESFE